MSPSKLKPDDIVDIIKNETKAGKGLICLNSIIQKSIPNDLNEFTIQSGIFSEKEVYSKTGYLLNLALFYYEEYHNREDLQVNYENTLELMGFSLLTDDIFKKRLMDYDFLSKSELIDVFSDFCADLGISVYDASKTIRYSLDLYLTRKTPLLRTEAVVLRTGMELSDKNAAFGIGTGDGMLGVIKLQLEGKKAMSSAEFLRGQRSLLSSVLF